MSCHAERGIGKFKNLILVFTMMVTRAIFAATKIQTPPLDRQRTTNPWHRSMPEIPCLRLADIEHSKTTLHGSIFVSFGGLPAKVQTDHDRRTFHVGDPTLRAIPDFGIARA